MKLKKQSADKPTQSQPFAGYAVAELAGIPFAKLVTIATLRASLLEQLHMEFETGAALEVAQDEAYKFGETLSEREGECGSPEVHFKLFNHFIVLEEKFRCRHFVAEAVPRTTKPMRQKRGKRCKCNGR